MDEKLLMTENVAEVANVRLKLMTQERFLFQSPCWLPYEQDRTDHLANSFLKRLKRSLANLSGSFEEANNGEGIVSNINPEKARARKRQRERANDHAGRSSRWHSGCSVFLQD